jgi:hypothetical protein
LSAVDILIGVGIGLGGSIPLAVVVHLLEGIREKNRVRRETVLTLLPDKQLALKDSYYTLIDLTILLAQVASNPPGTITEKDEDRIHESQVGFDKSVARAGLWMGSATFQRLQEAETLIGDACIQLSLGNGLSPKEFERLISIPFGTAGGAIRNELGVASLERQLQEFASRSSISRWAVKKSNQR